MTIKKHFILLFIGVSGWLFYYLVGLPSNYFSEWSLANQIIISMITFFSVVPTLSFLILIFMGGDYIKTALWTAFYASIPLMCLDYIVVGIIEGQGINYLISHWYITIAYFYVWIEIPVIGLAVRKMLSDV